MFDLALVLFSFADFFMSQVAGGKGAAPLGSSLKTLKMLRIVRVFRVFRFFRELNLLALMILDSVKSLMWALLMMCIILYVFAVLFTESATAYLNKNRDYSVPIKDDAPAVSTVSMYFGSMPKTLYVLIKCMLNGISWGEVADALLTMEMELREKYVQEMRAIFRELDDDDD